MGILSRCIKDVHICNASRRVLAVKIKDEEHSNI